MNSKNILVAFSCILAANVFAQSIPIKGKIIDSETKEQIVGAVVQLISNLQTGTTSNFEGKFTIATNRQSDSLKISFIGFGGSGSVRGTSGSI